MVRVAFPDAAPAEEMVGPNGPGVERAVTYRVLVADRAELSHRLAALLDAGALVDEVAPISSDLESRVQDRLEGDR